MGETCKRERERERVSENRNACKISVGDCLVDSSVDEKTTYAAGLV